MKRKTSLIIAILSTATLAISAEEQRDADGAVFTMNNSSNANQIIMFNREDNGTLAFAGEFPTGGLGTGQSLGNQGGVILSEGHRWLFAVNAGSHDVSAFAVSPKGLTLVDTVDSGGLNPISLAISGNLLYVLNSGGNAGGTDNITGFVVSSLGKLHAVPNSTRGLSAASTLPAQIGFSPDGNVLVITEKNTSLINTFIIEDDESVPGEHKIFQSPGTEPFGFAFDRKDHLFVTEAPGSAVSSYSVSDDGDLRLISRSVPDNQKAACWIAVTRNGRFGYAANAASNTTSGFRIDRDGGISLLTPNGVTGLTGAGPNDLTFSEDSHYLYTVNTAGGSISAFRVNPNGSLLPIDATAIPVGADGLAAY